MAESFNQDLMIPSNNYLCNRRSFFGRGAFTAYKHIFVAAGGAVVRALALYLCGPGFDPGSSLCKGVF